MKLRVTLSAIAVLFLSACTSMEEKALMEKVVFTESVNESQCTLVEEVACSSRRFYAGDVCTPWFQKRAVRQGGTHVITGNTRTTENDIYIGNSGVSAGKSIVGIQKYGRIYNCKTSH
ncbi:hypothetical protein [Marinibactrum halimedae]|uniref:Lipoprotein n=1 Tax=Marinibactrum halimedae TaxID=1444977 RepID=A0AA37T290_9GAMM|nr:hypothetical protein [Marinibactrum halimedae]MCD9459127.1 hypothetical protein [Marinibactrum halimedae]GLS24729.1 hypothetical protein GCM10007877_04430 [Marinibactrum halimedae]